jgi:tetratricopeptide (TPR) repeat protein
MSLTARMSALVATGLLLVVGLRLLQVRIDTQRAVTPKVQRFMYLPQGEYLRGAVLGYEQVVADLLWIQAIQAMGERKVTEEAGHWIYRALDVITTLDPKFVRVYEAGGIALVTLVVLPEESNRILEKGIQHNPDVWTLPYLLGFNYYFELHDDAKAADYIARASRLPGAPEYLAGLATRLYISAREPQVAIDFLVRMYEQTSDENVKRVLERRLKEVMVERDLQLLEEAISRYRKLYTRAPEGLEDLVGPGLLRALPREPFGGRYLYDPQTQAVRSSEMKERLKMYTKRRPR